MAIVKGARVRQIMPAPYEGVITEFQIDQEDGATLCRVDRDDGEGGVESKFFKKSDLEEVPTP